MHLIFQPPSSSVCIFHSRVYPPICRHNSSTSPKTALTDPLLFRHHHTSTILYWVDRPQHLTPGRPLIPYLSRLTGDNEIVGWATMTTTALSSNGMLRRLATADSTPTSSADISPAYSLPPSPSSTSISSFASEEPSGPRKLVDTYGNTFEIPNYTINEIHKAIPKHCFNRSGPRGLSYVARDIACLAVVFYLSNRFLTAENIPSTPIRAVAWLLYTFVQGLFGTGLWVLAHECGHQSFSSSKTLNDTVGWLVHSALLVPYFSWKISHGKHHKATGNMERDMVFVPQTRTSYASNVGVMMHELSELTEETPIATLMHVIRQQIGGWPVYLLANVTGHNFHERQSEGRGNGKKNGFGGAVNHFDPQSPLYESKDANLIILSDIGLLLTGSLLFFVGKSYGWSNLFVWYFGPYLWVNHWLGK